MCRCFQGFQRVDVQSVVNALGKSDAYPRDGMEQLERIQGSPKSLQLAPVPCGDELINRCSDSLSNGWQGLQTLKPFGLHQLSQVTLQLHYGASRIAIGSDAKRIGTLLFE